MPDNTGGVQYIPTQQGGGGTDTRALLDVLRNALKKDKSFQSQVMQQPVQSWAEVGAGIADKASDVINAAGAQQQLANQRASAANAYPKINPDEDTPDVEANAGGGLPGLLSSAGKGLKNLFSGGGDNAPAPSPTPSPAKPTPNSVFGDDGSIDPVHARTIAELESSGKASAPPNKYGYGGLYGFKAGQYGINDKNINDPVAQEAALRQEQKDLKTMLEARGIEATPSNLYMAHLHGAGGLISHTNNPDQPAWLSMAQTAEGRSKGKKAEDWARETVTANPYAPNMPADVTSGDYLKGWNDRYNRAYAKFSPDQNVQVGVVTPGQTPRPPAAVPAVASSTPAVMPPGVPPTLPPGGTAPPRIPYTDPKDLEPLQYAGARLSYEKPSFRNDLGLPPPPPPPPAPGSPTDQINKRFGPWQTDPRTGTTTPSPSMGDFNLDAKGNVRPVPLPQPRPGTFQGPLPYAPEGVQVAGSPAGAGQPVSVSPRSVPPAQAQPVPTPAPVAPPTPRAAAAPQAPAQPPWLEGAQITGARGAPAGWQGAQPEPTRVAENVPAATTTPSQAPSGATSGLPKFIAATQQIPRGLDSNIRRMLNDPDPQVRQRGDALWNQWNERVNTATQKDHGGYVYTGNDFKGWSNTGLPSKPEEFTFDLDVGGVKIPRRAQYVYDAQGNRSGYRILPEIGGTPGAPGTPSPTNIPIDPNEKPNSRDMKKTINSTPSLQPQFPSNSTDPNEIIRFNNQNKAYDRSYETFQKESDKIHNAGLLARDRLSQTNMLGKVLDSLPKTGKGTATLNDLNAAAHNLFGVGTAEEAAWRQIADKIASGQQVGDIRDTNVSQGVAVRQTESEAIKNSQFNLDKQIEANRAVVRMQQRALEREVEHDNLASLYEQRHGRLDNGFYRARSDYFNAHPFMTDSELARYKDITKPGDRQEGSVLPKGGTGGGGSTGGDEVPKIRSKEEFESLPSGRVFIDPTGQRRVKP